MQHCPQGITCLQQTKPDFQNEIFPLEITPRGDDWVLDGRLNNSCYLVTRRTRPTWCHEEWQMTFDKHSCVRYTCSAPEIIKHLTKTHRHVPLISCHDNHASTPDPPPLDTCLRPLVRVGASNLDHSPRLQLCPPQFYQSEGLGLWTIYK